VVLVQASVKLVVVVTKVRNLVLAVVYVQVLKVVMPLKQRLPKFGFTSRKSLVRAEVRLHELNLIKGDVVDIHALKDAGLITRNIVAVKVMLSGEITRPITLRGIAVTKGAQAAIEAAGGKIEE
jgi:large subunit ribosomal protein L15